MYTRRHINKVRKHLGDCRYYTKQQRNVLESLLSIVEINYNSNLIWMRDYNQREKYKFRKEIKCTR
jgi:hypothetical protein